MPLPSPPEGRSAYFPALTGIRALAAYGVFLYHSNPFTAGTLPHWLANRGSSGVSVFFVLSGFLICFRYLDRLEVSAQWFKSYFRNRVARIYPLYLLVTVLTFCLIAVDPSLDLTAQWPSYVTTDKLLVIGLNLTFLRGFFQTFLFTGIAQGWTLTVEECFYFLAPLLLLGLRYFKKPYLALSAYAVGLLLLGAALVAVLPHRFGLFASLRFLASFTIFGQCVYFLVGIGLALMVRRRAEPSGSPLPLWTYGSIASIGLILAVYSLVEQPGDYVLDGALNVPGLILGYLLAFAVAGLLWGLIDEESKLRGLLETTLFDKLGKSSYAFYLIHMGVFNQLMKRHITDSVPLLFIAMVVLAYWLYRFVEEPANRWIRTSQPKAPLKMQTPLAIKPEVS